MQYFIYVYSEKDKQILESAGLPMLHDKSDLWNTSTPYVFLVNGTADNSDIEKLMSRLSQTAILSNRMFFTGGQFAHRR